MSTFEDLERETLVDTRAIPRATTVLGGDDLVQQIRGLASQEIQPVSAAVVIGLGGTGVQTTARIKSAVRAGRIDQQAKDAVAFLAIDSVGQEQMNPPLPAGVTLGSDLMNLSGFNAGAYLSGQLPNDDFLKKWWDDDYKVQSGALSKGLQRERMLGRLCFHQNVSKITSAIESRFSQALEVSPEVLAAGHGGVDTGTLDVYLVCSSVGGTGSSAFLEVLAAIHRAAYGLGVTPKIRAFVMLPGAFADEIKNEQSSAVIAASQRANAYAFFKELDHFIKHEGELLPMLGHTDGPKLSNGDLIHSVYLMDATVGANAMINAASDLYEIVAESIYQFLFSTVGRAILGANGANIERILRNYDDFGKPRRYCSLGLSRLVFPGDTFRFHLVMWWCDRFIRAGFLKGLTPEEEEDLKMSAEVLELIDSLGALATEAGQGQFDDIVKTFTDIGRDAPASLRAQATVANAQDTIATLETMIPPATLEIRRVLEVLRPRLLARLTDRVETEVFSTTASVPRAHEIVRVLLKRSRAQLSDAESVLTAQIKARSDADDIVDERLEDLEVAEGRNIIEEAVAHVVGAINDEVMPTKETAEKLGQAIKDWTRAVVASEYAEARRDYLKQAVRELQRLDVELDGATKVLREMSDVAKAYWEQDELIGKDVGPRATSVLLPEDLHPDIELSNLSQSLRITIYEEHGHRLSDEKLSEFYQEFLASSLTRGFFDLGHREVRRSNQARKSLLARLEDDAIDLVLHSEGDDEERRARLPRDLVEAAEVLGEQARLGMSMKGLRGLSQNVCWSWEPGRFQLPGADGESRPDDRPQVTSAVVAHESIGELVKSEFTDSQSRADAPDPERVIAMSCEWAVPIHCLTAVNVWRQDYERLASIRDKQRTDAPAAGVEPPNHVDRRFEKFDELIPEYFKPEKAAPAFAKALTIAKALTTKETSEAVVGLFVRDATNPPMSPVHQKRGVGFVSHRVAVVDGQLRPSSDDDVPLGRDWSDALRSIGLDTGLQSSIEDCWQVVVSALDPSQLVEVINSIIDSKVNRGGRNRRRNVADDKARGHLKNAFEDLVDELEMYD